MSGTDETSIKEAYLAAARAVLKTPKTLTPNTFWNSSLLSSKAGFTTEIPAFYNTIQSQMMEQQKRMK